MEIVAFHFVPVEVIWHNPDGAFKTLSDIATRRVVKGFTGEQPVPAIINFTANGEYPLELAGNNITHTAKLILAQQDARVEMVRDERSHRVRSHIVVDMEGKLLQLRHGVVVIPKPEKREITGIGIGRRAGDNIAIEWYLSRVGEI